MGKRILYKGYNLFLEDNSGQDGSQYFVTIYKGSSQVDYTAFHKNPDNCFDEAKIMVDGMV
jgi:hypothetical protein